MWTTRPRPTCRVFGHGSPRPGEPVIRQAVATAVKIMGEQFVVGRTIEAALKRVGPRGLGCVASTCWARAPARPPTPNAMKRSTPTLSRPWARIAKGQGPEAGHGVSVKLRSAAPATKRCRKTGLGRALSPHPRRPRIAANKLDINFTIDAEEADRPALSLKLLERLAREPELATGSGLGLVVPGLSEGTTWRRPRNGRTGLPWPPPDGVSGQGRLLGHRDRCPGQRLDRLSGLHHGFATDLNYLVCAKALIEARPTSTQFPSEIHATPTLGRRAFASHPPGRPSSTSAACTHGRGPL